MDWVDMPKNYKGLYGILQLLQGSHLDNFPQKTPKLGRVAFHSLKFQFKCLDFQSNQYKKLAPVPSRFCNGLLQHCGALPRVRCPCQGHPSTGRLGYFDCKQAPVSRPRLHRKPDSGSIGPSQLLFPSWNRLVLF